MRQMFPTAKPCAVQVTVATSFVREIVALMPVVRYCASRNGGGYATPTVMFSRPAGLPAARLSRPTNLLPEMKPIRLLMHVRIDEHPHLARALHPPMRIRWRVSHDRRAAALQADHCAFQQVERRLRLRGKP